MKATFPFLGYDTLALRTFVEDLGSEVVLPPATSKHTVHMRMPASTQAVIHR